MRRVQALQEILFVHRGQERLGDAVEVPVQQAVNGAEKNGQKVREQLDDAPAYSLKIETVLRVARGFFYRLTMSFVLMLAYAATIAFEGVPTGIMKE